MESYIIPKTEIEQFIRRYKGFFPSLIFVEIRETKRRNCVEAIPIRLKENY